MTRVVGVYGVLAAFQGLRRIAERPGVRLSSTAPLRSATCLPRDDGARSGDYLGSTRRVRVSTGGLAMVCTRPEGQCTSTSSIWSDLPSPKVTVSSDCDR